MMMITDEQKLWIAQDDICCTFVRVCVSVALGAKIWRVDFSFFILIVTVYHLLPLTVSSTSQLILLQHKKIISIFPILFFLEIIILHAVILHPLQLPYVAAHSTAFFHLPRFFFVILFFSLNINVRLSCFISNIFMKFYTQMPGAADRLGRQKNKCIRKKKL